MLHEALHTLRIPNIADSLSGQLPPATIGGVPIREAYQWADIIQLTDAQKVKNAEGYTKLAVALWMKENSIADDGTMGPRRRHFQTTDNQILQMKPFDPHV